MKSPSSQDAWITFFSSSRGNIWLIEMSFIVTAAAVAGTKAASMYLDAKYHLRKDYREIKKIRKGTKMYLEAGKFLGLHLPY